MDQAGRNGVTFIGIPLEDAVRMASETPAEILGVFEKGRITPGVDADLVVLSAEGRGDHRGWRDRTPWEG